MREKFDRSQIPPAPDLRFEMPMWEKGVRLVAGIDEAGRGALAGPVAASAIILPIDPELEGKLRGVRDSKQMTPQARSKWASQLREIALTCAVGFSTSQEIDEIGILAATRLAVQRSLEGLIYQPQHLLVDYLALPDCPIPQTALVKGDARSLSIAAASILAKTARDGLLCQLDQEYPGYGFALHKGYATQAHLNAILKQGLSAVHRSSFHVKPGAWVSNSKSM